MSEEITDREEFIKIVGILSFSDVHPADCKYITHFIIDLAKENQQLKERIEYLERSNNRREDTMIENREELTSLQQENQQLKDELETSKQYEDYYKDLCDKALKTGGKYIGIIKEIREYIKKHSFFVDDTGYKKIIGYPKETYNAQDLLQILDKVKE